MKIKYRAFLVANYLCAFCSLLAIAEDPSVTSDGQSNSNNVADDRSSTDDLRDPDYPSLESTIASDKSPPFKEQLNSEIVSTDKRGNLTIEKLFDNAVESYLNEDWESCVDNFEEAIRRYKLYKKSVVECRRKCRWEANAAKPIFPDDIEDIHFYEKKVRETLCLMKCKKVKNNKDMKAQQLPIDVEIKYVERRPYEFLHICYFQMKRHQDAANAMFTFLMAHPKHDQSERNLRFYLDLPNVVQEEVKDMEAARFLPMYKAGLDAHDDENYPKVIEKLENSLKAYMDAEDDCRLYCEGPFDQGWLPDFTMSVANHFAYTLKCKRSCSYDLNNVNGEQRNDLLIDHYHYLQFAYFQTGKLKKACAAVESFLLFIPGDETVLKNKEWFRELTEVKKDYFKPRKEAVEYVRRQEYELRMLLYIQEEFTAVSNSQIELAAAD